MKVRLGDVLELNPRESIVKNTIARKISMTDLKPFTRDIPTFSYEKYSGGAKFRNNDILLARITPCLENGKTALVNILDKDEVAFGSTEYFVLRAKKGLIDPYYLYYLSISQDFRNVVIKSMTGTSGRQRAQKDAILEYKLDLPNIQEQQSIAKQLRALDDKIRLNKQINDNLLEFLDAIFVKKFLNSCKQKDTISDFAEITRGASPRPISKYIVPTGRPWVKISDVTSLTSPFLSETKEYISEEGIQNSRTVEPGDLILSNSATPGIPIFMDLEASVHDGWLIIRNLKMISKEWLYLYFRQMRKQLVAQSNGSVFNNLKTQIVKDFPMPLITQAEVDNFQQIVAPIFGDLKALHHENIQLKEIRDCLLSRYF
ncbi:restriction endonuclease subunit S [Lactobacillus delbrueckii]|uniref:restriction endonuclease subunit S n=1 Tax=Lactobacillus delbrueckii TaxID=1584 RepID=UPI002151079F|nr:restriction endonuclease subunit S [Lactobacillus delbrueckii]UUY35032.1 restriction endonuclease subunit S [Lactobacillus delbrueckii subsp. bulgaricus]